MKSSLKQKPTRYDLLVALAVLALAAAIFLKQFMAKDGGPLNAVVSCDGTVMEEISLSALKEDGQTISFSNNGITLRVHFAPDGVCVLSSTCPTQDCLHTGTIRRAGQSIVCLPAHVSIVLLGGATDYDLAAG